MKTTMEIRDPLFRKMKAQAASAGLSIRQLVTEAIEEKLAGRGQSRSGSGWRKVFGSLPGSAKDIDRIVRSEFERVDPADWR